MSSNSSSAPVAAVSAISADTLDLPVIDMSLWLSRTSSESATAACAAECRTVADSLHRYGLAVLKDPRATEADNDAFLDMMERYFEQPDSAKSVDVRKELHYQVRASTCVLFWTR